MRIQIDVNKFDILQKRRFLEIEDRLDIMPTWRLLPIFSLSTYAYGEISLNVLKILPARSACIVIPGMAYVE